MILKKANRILTTFLAACLILSAANPALLAYAEEVTEEETVVESSVPEEATHEETQEEAEEEEAADEVIEDEVADEATNDMTTDEGIEEESTEEKSSEDVTDEDAEEEDPVEVSEEDDFIDFLVEGYVLQNGTVTFTGKEDEGTVKTKLAEALIENYTNGMDLSDVEFEYYCEGSDSTGLGRNSAWGSVNGFESSKKVVITTVKYNHPALKDNTDANYQVRLAGTTEEVTVTKSTPKAEITVNEGVEVRLALNEDTSVNYDVLRQSILSTVVAESTPELTLENTTIEYYATATTGAVGNIGKDWVALEGDKKNALTYPAISAGNQMLKITFNGNSELSGTSVEVAIVITERSEAELTMADGTEIALAFDEDLNVNYNTVREAILATIEASEDLVLTVENTTITYYATATTGAVGGIGKKWSALEGEVIDLLTYPAMGAGEQQIKVSFAGDLTYKATSKEFTVKFNERAEADFTLNEGVSVQLVYDDELNVDFAGLREQIFNDVVSLAEKELTAEDVTIEYYAAPKTNINEAGKQWMPLEGGSYKVPVLGFEVEFAAISEGLRTIRVTYAGDATTAPTTHEVDINVLGRPELEYALNEAPFEVGFAFDEEMGYDYEATAQRILDAVIASTTPEVTDFTVEYNASLVDLGELKDFKPLNNNDITNLKKFGMGTWEIRIFWNGTKNYKDGNVIVTVTMNDSRIESVVAINESASFTYNMNGSVMKQAIFDNVIDWNNSVLPARDTLSVDNFEMTYKALPKQLDDIVARVGGILDLSTITEALKMSVPIEGMTVSISDVPAIGGVLGGLLGDIQMLEYPSIGAGTQQVQISYKGNPEYRPSSVETTVNIRKANVSVNVQWTNIRAGQPMPANFITTTPADSFNIYTIYTGITSSVSLGIYLDLPDSLTDSGLLKVIDPIVQGILGKTLTQMMNDGMSVGELRQLFRAQELLNFLNGLGVDTGALGKVLNILDSTSGIVDGIRVSFGTPSRAGLYSAIAVTENRNYNVGVGYGTILVRMNTSGVKLNWNQGISGSMTSAQAKEFDFGVTLSVDGDVTVNQSNVHYLYSGLTSKFRVYSSTTTPPTEPGSYVVTVVTLGGDYLAAPITRSFRITK